MASGSLNGKPMSYLPIAIVHSDIQSKALTHTRSTVFKQPLKLFSQQPMTGYFRDGYCRTGGNQDPGNHAVAGIVTDEFLDFSASRGNDLRTVGLSEY
ncbi:hypothetical protein F4679DRAFT_541095 [Xylaria curta]|nr:hypothetical protein F4679DRAFT_541095 [Xylaria curta]